MQKTIHPRIGRAMQKALLLMQTGVMLSVTRRPDKYFRIIKNAGKEWQKINEKYWHRIIKNLYASKLITCQEDKDGNVMLTLNDNGKKRALQYNLDTIKIKKPKEWDGFWRLVIFDIPENKKQARNALSFKLKQMGFYPFQKSVFIHPYDCRDEVDFLIEVFDVRPYVRFIIAKETDVDLKLKQHFNL